MGRWELDGSVCSEQPSAFSYSSPISSLNTEINHPLIYIHALLLIEFDANLELAIVVAIAAIKDLDDQGLTGSFNQILVLVP